MTILVRQIQIQAAADVTPPTLTAPNATATGQTTASGSVSTNEGNGTLYYLASANATETAATVVSTGSSQAVSGTGTQNVNVTGLTAATSYYLHFVHVDAASNQSSRVTSEQITTSPNVTGTIITRQIQIQAAADVTAPTLTSPTGTATGATTASGSVSTNEGNGTLFRLASTNATETAATVIAANQSQAVTGTGSQAVTFTGLAPSTVYYAHYVHRDAANNTSARVSSSSFTTSASTGGTIITRQIQILPLSDSIISVSGSTAGGRFSLQTGGAQNLYTGAPSLTYAGIACTSLTVTSAATLDFTMPATGIELGSENDFVLTVGGSPSPGFPETFLPALGQFATFTVPFDSFSPDSWARDDELVGIVEGIVAGDQIEAALKTNGTTSTPAGYDVNINGLGDIWLSDPTGSEGNLEAEEEEVAVNLTLIDASDGYARGPVMSAVIAINMPAGTLTLGTPVVGSTTAALPFTWTGTNADSFEYQIGTGAIVAASTSPISLTGLTASTTYSYRVRPKNGSWPGQWVSGTFTTQSASGTMPDPFEFVDQVDVPISTQYISNSIQITGVAAGQDIATTITGGEYSVSTDNGATYGAWTSAGSNVRLNYRIRLRLTSSANHESAVSATLTVGGRSGTWSLSTIEDSVAPVITLTGGNITLTVGDVWTEPGFSATDNQDGTIPPERLSSTGTVDTDTPGTYTITYGAEDLAGNIGTTTRTVTVVAASSGLQVDSAPAEINRYGTFNLVLSGAVEAPTVLNTAIRVNGATGPQLTTTGVTGSGPWTIAVTARFDVPIKFSTVGYPLHITVGDETVQTEAIPMLAGVLPFVDLLTVATGPGTIHDVFPQWVLGVADQIIHQAATRIAGVPVAIDSSGTPRLLGPLLVNDSIIYRVIKADGTVSTVPPNLEFTFQPTSEFEFISDVVPRLLAVDASLVRVFIDRDNTVRVRITHDGTAINMEQFTRLVLSGFPDDIDSDDNPEAFDVTEGDGVLDLMLGQLLTSPGVYKLRLVGYSQLHANGVVLIDPSLVDASVTAIVLNA